MTRYRLVAFDLDGTLIIEKSSWGKVNEFFGNEDSSKSMKLFKEGLIDYHEFMRRDISSWPKPLHISTIRDILSGWTLREGAEHVVSKIKERGIEVAIISGGIRTLAEDVAKRLGIKLVKANILETDDEGFLTGEGIMEVDPLRKDVVLREVAEEVGISVRECVAVADSDMDISFLKTAGLGLLLGDEELARRIGVKRISSLYEVLDYVKC